MILKLFFVCYFTIYLTNAETEKTYSSLPVEVKRQPVMVLNEKNFEKVTKRLDLIEFQF